MIRSSLSTRIPSLKPSCDDDEEFCSKSFFRKVWTYTKMHFSSPTVSCPFSHILLLVTGSTSSITGHDLGHCHDVLRHLRPLDHKLLSLNYFHDVPQCSLFPQLFLFMTDSHFYDLFPQLFQSLTRTTGFVRSRHRG